MSGEILYSLLWALFKLNTFDFDTDLTKPFNNVIYTLFLYTLRIIYKRIS